MNYLRKITVGIACGLLPLILFGFGLSFSLYQTIGKPDSIKTALSDSGVYVTASSGFVDTLQKDAGKEQATEGVELPVEQAGIKKAVAEAFPPASLKTHVDGLIENTYRWMQGETANLDLKLDLAENQTNLLANLRHQAKERAGGLPQCEKPPTEERDIFSATCLPAGVTPDAAADKVVTELRSGEFFKQQSIDISSVKDETGQTLETRLKDVPSFYETWVKGTWAGGILALLLLAGVIFLSRPWQSGVRRTAKIFLAVGISSALFAWFSNFLVSKLGESVTKTGEGTESLQTTLLEAVRILAQDLRLWWLGYGLFLIIMGAVALVYLRVVKQKNAPPLDEVKPLESTAQDQPNQAPHNLKS